jgi:hypothetical protein
MCAKAACTNERFAAARLPRAAARRRPLRCLGGWETKAVRRRVAWHGMAWHGMAWHGMTQRGMMVDVTAHAGVPAGPESGLKLKATRWYFRVLTAHSVLVGYVLAGGGCTKGLGTSRVCAGGVLQGTHGALGPSWPRQPSPAQREGGPAHLHALDPEISGVVRIRVRKRRRECSLHGRQPSPPSQANRASAGFPVG